MKKAISKSAFSQPPQQTESASNTQKERGKGEEKQHRMRWRRNKFTVGVEEREAGRPLITTKTHAVVFKDHIYQ